ncbi:hypothetical protein RB195_014435 [Necator americanus]
MRAHVFLLALLFSVIAVNCEQHNTNINSRFNHRQGRWFSWNVPYELVEKEWFGWKGLPTNEKHVVQSRSDKMEKLFDDSLPSYDNRFEWRFNRL